MVMEALKLHRLSRKMQRGFILKMPSSSDNEVDDFFVEELDNSPGKPLADDCSVKGSSELSLYLEGTGYRQAFILGIPFYEQGNI